MDHASKKQSQHKKGEKSPSPSKEKFTPNRNRKRKVADLLPEFEQALDDFDWSPKDRKSTLLTPVRPKSSPPRTHQIKSSELLNPLIKAP